MQAQFVNQKQDMIQDLIWIKANPQQCKTFSVLIMHNFKMVFDM